MRETQLKLLGTLSRVHRAVPQTKTASHGPLLETNDMVLGLLVSLFGLIETVFL